MSDAWGKPWAFRPQWTDETTLTIEFQVVGFVGCGEFEFVFEDDRVHMWYCEVVTGTAIHAVANGPE